LKDGVTGVGVDEINEGDEEIGAGEDDLM